MIQKELQNNPALKDENWERFLPKLPPKSKEIKDKLKAKAKLTKLKIKKGHVKKGNKEYNPFPPPPAMSKIDLQLESGEYFKNAKVAKDSRKVERRNEKDVAAYGQKKEFNHQQKMGDNKSGGKKGTGFKSNQRGGKSSSRGGKSGSRGGRR